MVFKITNEYNTATKPSFNKERLARVESTLNL